MSFACMYMCTTYLEVRRWHQIPWNRNYRWLCHWFGCLETNPGILQEQQVLLNFFIYYYFFSFFSELGTETRALRLLGKCSTTKLNPQPLIIFFIIILLAHFTSCSLPTTWSPHPTILSPFSSDRWSSSL